MLKDIILNRTYFKEITVGNLYDTGYWIVIIHVLFGKRNTKVPQATTNICEETH